MFLLCPFIPAFSSKAARFLSIWSFFFRSTFFGKGQKARSPFSASVYSPPPRSLRFPNGRTCFSGVIKRRCLRRPPPPSSTLPIKGTKKKKKIAQESRRQKRAKVAVASCISYFFAEADILFRHNMQLRGEKISENAERFSSCFLNWPKVATILQVGREKRQEDCHVTTDLQGPSAQENKKGLPISQIGIEEEDATFHSLSLISLLSLDPCACNLSFGGSADERRRGCLDLVPTILITLTKHRHRMQEEKILI